METLTTHEALIYISQQTNKMGKVYTRQQLSLWRRYGWIKQYRIGSKGAQSLYTVAELDKLCDKIVEKKYKQNKVDSNNRIERQRLHIGNNNARRHSLPATLTIEQWQHALNYFNGCCAVCGRQLNDMFGEFKVAMDHWIPLAYKGDGNPGTAATNIVPLCHGSGGCNNDKRDNPPGEWLERKFGERKGKKIAARIQEYFDSIEGK